MQLVYLFQRYARVLIICFLFAHVDGAFSAEDSHAYVLSNADKQDIPKAAIDYLADPQGTFTIDQIVKGDAGNFKQLEKSSFGYNYPAPVLWVRFSLDVKNFKEPYLLLTQNYEHVGHLTLYYPSSNGYKSAQLIETVPADLRQFEIHNYLFQIPKPDAQIATYYMRFVPRGHVLSVALSVSNTKGFVEYLHANMLEMGLFFGSLLAMLGFNVVLLAYLRDRAYLYYVYYLATFIATFVYMNGFAPLMVPMTPFYERLFTACGFMTIHGSVLFTRQFLSLKTSTKWIDKYLWLMQWLLVTGGVSLFFLAPGNAFYYGFITLDLLIVFTAPAMVIAGFRRLFQGFAPARLYCAGWVVLGSSMFILVLKSLGVLGSNAFTTYAVQVASVWETILFALALAYRFDLNTKKEAAAKNAFLGMISHELKTPMQTIMSSLDLLSVQPAEKDKEIWKRLNSSVEHLEMQMKDLTDYARLESGRLHLRTLPIDATKLLTNIAVEFREVAENKGLVFTTDIENIGQKLLSDSLRIEQIANNLIGNAIKYTETGHVKVGLRYIENHSHLVLSVEDTGVGISDKDKRTLFEPFTQIDQTSTRKHDGIGMGLAVVQKLVILFGGSISVTSVVGKGSTFTVMLPAEKSPITISETMSDEDDADSNRRVMLVDDNQNVRETLKAVLEQLTYSCDAAEDGSHALKFLEQRKYAAILLDVNMPVMDGFAVASRIRNTVGRNQEVPIIWISATQPQNITPEEKALFTHFLEKPIRANKLDAMLKKIVT